MTLADRLATPPAPKRGKGLYDKWLDQLPESDREAVLTAVKGNAWGHSDLLAALIEEGAPEITASTFAYWRKGQGWTK